ncbi:MAG: T9SS type B sorting domain-containing protein [Weeksellaceae bacterium]
MPLKKGVVDDKFSDLIPLGFDFCFYDETYSNIIIGTNGILSFDVDDAEADNPTTILERNPSPKLVDNAIFGVQHDLIFDTSQDSEIYYSVQGVAPCRMFIINYYKAENYKCPETSTVQIVLHESTNEIDIHILQKPEPCDNGRVNNALLGIINNGGNKGVSPSGRNTGIWSAKKESWKFKPSGKKSPIIIWKDEEGEEIGTGEILELCSYKDNTYTAEVWYQSCNSNPLYLSDDIRVHYDDKFPLVDKDKIFVCDSNDDGVENIVLSSYNDYIAFHDVQNFKFEYYLSEEDAEISRNPQIQFNLNSNKTFYLKMINKNDSSCFTITPINFKFSGTAFNDLTITLCDNNNDKKENNVYLTPYIKTFFEDIDYKGFTIHRTKDEANIKSNAITRDNLTTDTKLWINLEINEGCIKTIGPVTISFLKAPKHRATRPIILNECDINFNQNEPFEWDEEIRAVMNIEKNERFTVHQTYSEAVSGKNKLTQISDAFTEYYVRIMNGSGCFTVVKQPVEVEFYGVEANNVQYYYCFDGSEDKTINLESYLSDMLIDPLEGVKITFYASSKSAEEGIEDQKINPIQVIKDNGSLVTKEFYVRFELEEDKNIGGEEKPCYTVRSIEINLVHPEPQRNPIAVCDIYNDEVENNLLKIYDLDILGTQMGQVKYYKTLQDANNQTNEISAYNFTEDTTLYVVIESHGCSEVHDINFHITAVPEVENVAVNIGNICDSDNDGINELDLTAFNKQVYKGTSSATFNYYLAYDESTKTFSKPIKNPKSYPITDNLKVYIEVNVDGYECNTMAIAEAIIDKDNPFTIVDSELYRCDFEGDLNEIFNLNKALSQISINLQNYDSSMYQISFHKKEEDAIAGLNALQNNEFMPNAAEYILYVRAQHLFSGCVDIKTLKLYTLGPPKPVAGTIAVCDNNLNGLYDLDLNEIPSKIMDERTGFVFSYHFTEDDALIDNNAIDKENYLEMENFPEVIWVRVERERLEDCFDVKPVYISFNPILKLDKTTFNTYSCDFNNQGTAIFDLTFLEEFVSTNEYTISYYENYNDIVDNREPIQNPKSYSNVTPYHPTVYAKVEKEGYCPTTAAINLTYATINVAVEDVKFCPGKSVSIYPEVLDKNADYSYQWLDENDNVISTSLNLYNLREEQDLTLLITNNTYPNCQKSLPVNLSTYDVPKIVDLIEDENGVTVIASGSYPIEYSINGIDWQHSNYFNGLQPAYYNFWVRYVDKQCLGEPEGTAILYIPNIITPNGDGKNDKFIINNLDAFGDEESTLIIYDRYGKEIYKKSDNRRIEWDGYYLGRPLNTTDYWYQLMLPDGRIKTGHITVKNF